MAAARTKTVAEQGIEEGVAMQVVANTISSRSFCLVGVMVSTGS